MTACSPINSQMLDGGEGILEKPLIPVGLLKINWIIHHDRPPPYCRSMALASWGDCIKKPYIFFITPPPKTTNNLPPHWPLPAHRLIGGRTWVAMRLPSLYPTPPPLGTTTTQIWNIRAGFMRGVSTCEMEEWFLILGLFAKGVKHCYSGWHGKIEIFSCEIMWTLKNCHQCRHCKFAWAMGTLVTRRLT